MSFFYKKGFEMKPSFEFSEKHLFQTSDELRSRMAEIQQLRTAILVVEAADPATSEIKTAAESAQHELRA